MLNKEKYVNELLNFASAKESFAVTKNGKPVDCDGFECERCAFYDEDEAFCQDLRKKWMDSEYAEPPIDWSKVPVDTPILVRDNENDKWKRRYFAKHKDGVVYAWCGGVTSWTSRTKDDIYSWNYAELAESED